MIAKNAAFVFSLFLVSPAGRLNGSEHQRTGTKSTAPCSLDKIQRREETSDKLHSWSELHAYYLEYRSCTFDADAAEGVSDSIGWLLSNRWDTVPFKLLAKDSAFRNYVLEGANATLEPYTLRGILNRTKDSRCNKGPARSFCRELREQVIEALAEGP